MDKFCENCGNEVDENQRFCGNCGNQIPVNSQPNSVVNQPGLQPEEKKSKSGAIMLIAGVVVVLMILVGVGMMIVDFLGSLGADSVIPVEDDGKAIVEKKIDIDTTVDDNTSDDEQQPEQDKSINDYLVGLTGDAIDWQDYKIIHYMNEIDTEDSQLDSYEYYTLYIKNDIVELVRIDTLKKIPEALEAGSSEKDYQSLLVEERDELLKEGAFLSNSYDVIEYSNVGTETEFVASHMIVNNVRYDGPLYDKDWQDYDALSLTVMNDEQQQTMKALLVNSSLDDKLGIPEAAVDGSVGDKTPDDDTISTVSMFGNEPYEEGCGIEYYFGEPFEGDTFIFTQVYGFHVKDSNIRAVEDIVLVDLKNPDSMTQTEKDKALTDMKSEFEEAWTSRINGQLVIEAFNGVSETGVASFIFYVYEAEKDEIDGYHNWLKFFDVNGYEKRSF